MSGERETKIEIKQGDLGVLVRTHQTETETFPSLKQAIKELDLRDEADFVGNGVLVSTGIVATAAGWMIAVQSISEGDSELAVVGVFISGFGISTISHWFRNRSGITTNEKLKKIKEELTGVDQSKQG